MTNTTLRRLATTVVSALLVLCGIACWSCTVSISMPAPACVGSATWYEDSKDFIATVTYDDYAYLDGNVPQLHISLTGSTEEAPPKPMTTLLSKNSTTAVYKLPINTWDLKSRECSFYATIDYRGDNTASSQPFSKTIHNGIECTGATASVTSPTANASYQQLALSAMGSTHQATWYANSYSGGVRTRVFKGMHAQSQNQERTWREMQFPGVTIPVGIGATTSSNEAYGETGLVFDVVGQWQVFARTWADGDNNTARTGDSPGVPFNIIPIPPQ